MAWQLNGYLGQIPINGDENPTYNWLWGYLVGSFILDQVFIYGKREWTWIPWDREPWPMGWPICKRANVHTGGQFKVGDLYLKEIQLPIKKK